MTGSSSISQVVPSIVLRAIDTRSLVRVCSASSLPYRPCLLWGRQNRQRQGLVASFQVRTAVSCRAQQCLSLRPDRPGRTRRPLLRRQG